MNLEEALLEVQKITRHMGKPKMSAAEYNAWEKYIKEEYADAENELVKETEKRESAEKKANDYQVGGSHYKDKRVQPWDVIDTWSREQRIGFYRGNALKYLMRMGSKDESLQEIQKGSHYLQKLIEVLSEPS